MVFVVVAVVGLLIWALFQASEECEQRGGEMIGTGHYTTTYVQSGKVMIPIESEQLECSVAE